jgi:hypothetical protein
MRVVSYVVFILFQPSLRVLSTFYGIVRPCCPSYCKTTGSKGTGLGNVLGKTEADIVALAVGVGPEPDRYTQTLL